MSDLNYGLGFYLIEVATNQYDLFNSVTDNRILEAQPKDKIINFLELNLPTHPFLHQVDQENSWGSFTSTTDDDLNKFFKYIEDKDKEFQKDADFFSYVSDKYKFDYSGYNVATADEYFYNSSNYGEEDDYFVIDEDGLREEYGDDRQLEFNFTYKDNKSTRKTNPSNNSPSIEDEELPYLPDETDE